MNRKTILGVIVALLFCTIIAGAFIILAEKKQHARREKESFKEEVRKLQRKLAFNSSDPDRNFTKAKNAEGRSDWEDALYYYKFLAGSLPENDPRKGYSYYKEAQCYYNLNDFGRARRSLEFSLNHYPDSPQTDSALFLMAQIYLKFGEFTNAYKTYGAIMRIFPYRADEAKKLQDQLPEVTKKLQEEQKKAPGVAPIKP
jgi:TolA-binding protein